MKRAMKRLMGFLLTLALIAGSVPAALAAGSDPIELQVSFVGIENNTYSIPAERDRELTAKFTAPEGTAIPTDAQVEWTWESYEPAIVKVVSNNAAAENTAVIRGQTVDQSTTITAKVTITWSEGGVDYKAEGEAVCTVLVGYAQITRLEIEPSIELEVGGTETLYALVEPNSADKSKLEWSIEDEIIAEMSSSLDAATLTGKEPGKTVITVRDTGESKKEDTCNVTVRGLKIKEGENGQEAVTLYITLKEGESVQLAYTRYPENLAGNMAWESRQTNVATVNAVTGMVTAQAAGEARIVARLGDYEAVCIVTVEKNMAAAVTDTAVAGSPFRFRDLADKLNDVCKNVMDGVELDFIDNLKVSTSEGILYYQYTSPSDPGYGVGAERYYRAEGVSGRRSLSEVSFVPRSDLTGTATITYTGHPVGDNNRTYTGEIILTVEKGGDVVYSISSEETLTFQAEDFNAICQQRQNKSLNYVTFELPSPSKGTLYYNFVTASQFAEKVTNTERYYRTRNLALDKVTFVPAEGFSGTVTVNYRAVDIAGGAYSGTVTINVSGSGEADRNASVSYSASYGERVTFAAIDFADACYAAIGETLDCVRFDLPLNSVGALYYTTRNREEAVSNTAWYYRGDSPYLSSVSFVPAEGVTGTVSIAFTGHGEDGGRFSGHVYIDYPQRAGNGEVSYTTQPGREVQFNAADFNEMSLEATGAPLDYVNFDDLPEDDTGTLYYSYSGTGRGGSKVTTSRSYYRSADDGPCLSDVSFVPERDYLGSVYVNFTGYNTAGGSFDGRVRVLVAEGGAQDGAYTTISGGRVTFHADDFYEACQAALGDGLDYVCFTLPAAGEGSLQYKYDRTAKAYFDAVDASTRYYYDAKGRCLVGDVDFVANRSFTGTAQVHYTGYSVGGDQFSGSVEVKVFAPTAQDVWYGGGSAPIRLQGVDFNRVCTAVLGNQLSYLTFTGLPESSEGRLYVDYTGPSAGTRAALGTKYYFNGDPGLDQLSFVAKAGFAGTVEIPYTAVDADDNQIYGSLMISVEKRSTTAVFTDMGSYGWAVPAVEYLYHGGVIIGDGTGKYNPSHLIRRGDFVLMLCRTFRFEMGSVNSGFSDVPVDSYYAQAITAAKKLGIITESGGKFMPEQPLVRQDAMVMLFNAMKAAGWDVPDGSGYSLSAYGDSGAIANYARNAVAAMVQMGAVKGDGTWMLKPGNVITRAEVAAILYQGLTI